MNHISRYDSKLTRSIYKKVGGNHILNKIPKWFGYIPYELYISIGSVIAVIITLVTGSAVPIQIHLLPHFVVHQIVHFLKRTFKRERPGFRYADMEIRNNKWFGHKERYKSCPSGHAATAFALFIAFMLELDKWDYEHKRLIQCISLWIVFCVLLHRVSNGYHYVGDIISGSAIGIIVGYVCYEGLDYFSDL